MIEGKKIASMKDFDEFVQQNAGFNLEGIAYVEGNGDGKTEILGQMILSCFDGEILLSRIYGSVKTPISVSSRDVLFDSGRMMIHNYRGGGQA